MSSIEAIFAGGSAIGRGSPSGRAASSVGIPPTGMPLGALLGVQSGVPSSRFTPSSSSETGSSAKGASSGRARLAAPVSLIEANRPRMSGRRYRASLTLLSEIGAPPLHFMVQRRPREARQRPRREGPRSHDQPRSRRSRGFDSKMIGEAHRKRDRPGVGLYRAGNRPQGRSRVDARRVPRRPYEALLRINKDAPVLIEHVIEATLDDYAVLVLIC